MAPEYAFGERGSFSFPSVAPNAALEYDVELLAFEAVAEDRPRSSLTYEERLEAAARRRAEGNAHFQGDRLDEAVSRCVTAGPGPLYLLRLLLQLLLLLSTCCCMSIMGGRKAVGLLQGAGRKAGCLTSAADGEGGLGIWPVTVARPILHTAGIITGAWVPAEGAPCPMLQVLLQVPAGTVLCG